jgi:hypothetical protein
MQQGPQKIFPLMLIRVAGLPSQQLNALSGFPMKTPADAQAAQVQQAFDKTLAALPAETGLRTAVYNARREFFQKRKMPPAAFYQVARNAPEVPEMQVLLKKLEKWAASEGDSADLAHYEAVLRDNYLLLQKIAESETIQRGLLFSSHVLLGQLSEFVRCPVAQFGKKERRIALSLLQYLNRATVKTSPLSRWTTVDMQRSTGDIADDPLPFSTLKPQATPNVALLPALYELLLREPTFRRGLSVALNPGITKTAEGALEWLFFDGENEAFQRTETDAVADLVVDIMQENGFSLPFPRLLAALEEQIDAPPAAVEQLILDLIDLGLLEWRLPETGLSAGWCGGLYQFLGFLSGQPPIAVETAFLLQWLRTAARTLPFQAVQEAAAAQREARQQVRDFFVKHSSEAPDIPAEQIFFEDVAENVQPGIPENELNGLIAELRACWLGRHTAKMPERYVQMCAFAAREMDPGQEMAFLLFCRKFLENDHVASRENLIEAFHPPETRKIGALLQVFRDESGRYRTVVNGLFPGGGKMFARWLHLFPADHTAQLAGWFDETSFIRAPFPWQGWSNANFQPRVAKTGLAVPDGRAWQTGNEPAIRLADLGVRLEPAGPRLFDRSSGKPVVFSDLGLESPDLRPPAMQVLWHLGMPYVSLESLLPERRWERAGEGCHHTPRLESGNLVLAREAWRVDATVTKRWLAAGRNFEFFRLVRNDLSRIGLSPRFFARYSGEKPQFFDLENPLSILLFSKTLKHDASPVFLTEMLPAPGECIVEKDGLRAAEFVIEFEV